MTEEDRSPPLSPQQLAAEVRPEPKAAGSEGSQEEPPESTTKAVVQLVQPLTVDQNNLGAALGEFSDARSPVVAAIAIAAFRDADHFRAAVMEKWNNAEREKETVRQSYYQEKEKNAVLEERQLGRTRLRRVQQLALILGGLIAGGGLSISLDEKTLLGLGGVLLIVGLAVLWLGSPLSVKDD